MLLYISKRLAATVLVIVAASMLTFLILNLIPGVTPIMILKYAFIGLEEVPNDSEIATIIERFNLNDPLYKQYFRWLMEVLGGNLGTSYVYGLPVSTLLLSKLPATVLLAATSTVFSLVISIPLGIVSAINRNTLIDHFCRLGSLFFVSMPNFWLGLILIIIFSLKLDLFPVTGYGKLEHLVLPCLTLGSGMAAVTTRVMRSSMLEVLNQDYIITARAKGLSETIVIFRHAVRNALLPVITVAGLQFGHLLGGSVIVETVFSWPGVGKLLVDSILARDIPLIQGCILLIATAYALINLFVDLFYALLDPKIRYGRGL
ncbi:MAG TPA: glutathione ABC transporter permease GsiC [Peptococcaceae bacterium]|nr:MAG: Binding-protein-dependent transport systems inner membrane component [Clostridia bacterium 41_269]HBT20559.1 glutathione ABC transporter permease GsiC [Peptococcaceae bacterium]